MFGQRITGASIQMMHVQIEHTVEVTVKETTITTDTTFHTTKSSRVNSSKTTRTSKMDQSSAASSTVSARKNAASNSKSPEPKAASTVSARKNAASNSKSPEPKAAQEDATGSASNSSPDYSMEHVRNLYDNDAACLCEFFNRLLEKNSLAKGYLPLKEDNLFDKLQDGMLLCAMANALKPGTIDNKSVHCCASLKGEDGHNRALQNLRLALTSLATVGIETERLQANPIYKASSTVYVGLLMQILRVATLGKMSLIHNENLIYLMDDWQSPDATEQLKSKTQEDVLKLWVNYQLRKAGTDLVMQNFGDSLADSAIYANLLQVVAPDQKKTSLTPVSDILSTTDTTARAAKVVKNAEILGITGVITPDHIVRAASGVGQNLTARDTRLYLLHVAFIYEIYSRYHNIDEPAGKGNKKGSSGGSNAKDVAVSKRQKKPTTAGGVDDETLRMWLNSFGVNPIVNFLDTDLRSGVVLAQVWEAMIPGSINKKKIREEDPTDLAKRKFQWLSNCSEVMECANKHGVKVNCSASDIATGDVKNTLALVFVMMRLHSQIQRRRVCGSNSGDLDDDSLVAWVNQRMEQSGESFRLKNINDPALKKTNVLAYLGERVLVEKGRLFSGATAASRSPTKRGTKSSKASPNRADESWMFKKVENVPSAGSQLAKYSSAVIVMFRRSGVTIFASQIGPETDISVFRDVLLQLNAIAM